MWLPQDGALKIENLQFTQSVLVTDYTHTHTHTHTPQSSYLRLDCACWNWYTVSFDQFVILF